MIGQGRTRGQVAILDIDTANNQNCAAIWVSPTPVPPMFVFYWLMNRYEETRGEGSGNNQQALSKSLVEAIPMPLPPLRSSTVSSPKLTAGCQSSAKSSRGSKRT